MRHPSPGTQGAPGITSTRGPVLRVARGAGSSALLYRPDCESCVPTMAGARRELRVRKTKSSEQPLDAIRGTDRISHEALLSTWIDPQHPSDSRYDPDVALSWEESPPSATSLRPVMVCCLTGKHTKASCTLRHHCYPPKTVPKATGMSFEASASRDNIPLQRKMPEPRTFNLGECSY